jgi:hypothetical protein
MRYLSNYMYHGKWDDRNKKSHSIEASWERLSLTSYHLCGDAYCYRILPMSASGMSSIGSNYKDMSLKRPYVVLNQETLAFGKFGREPSRLELLKSIVEVSRLLLITASWSECLFTCLYSICRSMLERPSVLRRCLSSRVQNPKQTPISQDHYQETPQIL